MKLISFITACYNAEKYIHRCFDNSYIENDEVEYLFVDDKSCDNTVKIIKNFAEQHNNIRLIKKEHTGANDTYNVGINNAMGKFFILLDADDYIEKDKIIKLLNIIKTNDNLDLLLFDFVLVNPSTNSSFINSLNKYVPTNKTTNLNEFKRLPITSFLMKHNMLINTDLFRNNKFIMPNTMAYGDTNIVFFSLLHCKNIYYLNEVFYHYFISIANQTTSFDNMTKNYKYYFDNLLTFINYVKEDEYINLSKKKKKMLSHLTFIHICATINATFYKYIKARNKEYIKCMKAFKHNNYSLYKDTFYKTILLSSIIVPKIIISSMCKITRLILKKKILWTI